MEPNVWFRTQRENCIQLLCSFQSELHEAVGALNKAIDCKEEMNSMKKRIEDHEFALRKFGNDRARAAEYLGISQTTLWRRLRGKGIGK
jgi:DNA-binding NtrC family response regulator